MEQVTITQEHLDANPDLIGQVEIGDIVTLNAYEDELPETDPHYGEAGHYDEKGRWIPSV